MTNFTNWFEIFGLMGVCGIILIVLFAICRKKPVEQQEKFLNAILIIFGILSLIAFSIIIITLFFYQPIYSLTVGGLNSSQP